MIIIVMQLIYSMRESEYVYTVCLKSNIITFYVMCNWTMQIINKSNNTNNKHTTINSSNNNRLQNDMTYNIIEQYLVNGMTVAGIIIITQWSECKCIIYVCSTVLYVIVKHPRLQIITYWCFIIIIISFFVYMDIAQQWREKKKTGGKAFE